MPSHVPLDPQPDIEPACHPGSRWILMAQWTNNPQVLGECEGCRDSMDAYFTTLHVQVGDRVVVKDKGELGVVFDMQAARDGTGWRNAIAAVLLDSRARVMVPVASLVLA